MSRKDQRRRLSTALLSLFPLFQSMIFFSSRTTLAFVAHSQRTWVGSGSNGIYGSQPMGSSHLSFNEGCLRTSMSPKHGILSDVDGMVAAWSHRCPNLPRRTSIFGLSAMSSADNEPPSGENSTAKKENEEEEKVKDVGQRKAKEEGGTQRLKQTEEEREEKWLYWMSRGTPRPRWDDETEPRTMQETIKTLKGIQDTLDWKPRGDRYSSRDWAHNVVTFPRSAVLKDVQKPVLAMTLWATFIALLHRKLSITNPEAAASMCIPPNPHSFMVSALGLLLVFRTNSAYQRFNEGRKIWEDILNSARDLSRMAKLYEVEIGTEKRRRVQRLLAAFPYLLRHRIRPNIVMRKLDDPTFDRDPEHSLILYQDAAAIDNDAEAAKVAKEEEITGKSRRKTRPLYWVDKRTLPWRLLPKGVLEGCARSQNRPLWVCDRMSRELWEVPDGPNFSARERLALLSHVDKLSRAIGGCERIHQTVVPLNYARHALRSLAVWLLSLPFALVKDLGLLTGPVLFFISWMLFGVYEIGFRIEDPFQGTLRLSILCDAIRRDVLADELIRDTAFNLDPEPDGDDVESEYEDM